MEVLHVRKQNSLFDLIEQGADNLALELLKGDNKFTEDELNKSLISICHPGHKFIVPILVQHGANINYRDTKGNTPLLISAQHGLIATIEFLLKYKADVNASNSVGDSALILSIRSPTIKTAQILLAQKDIKIDHQNQDGYTAIMKAAEVQNIGTLKILLDKYFNNGRCTTSPPTYDAPNDEHKTYKYISKRVRDYVSQRTTLRQIKNCKGENVFEIAENYRFESVLRLLLEHASTNISPLELAMRANDIKSFHILLGCKFLYPPESFLYVTEVLFLIFKKCDDKDTIHFDENEITMIKTLLEYGVDVNIKHANYKLMHHREHPGDYKTGQFSSMPISTQRTFECKINNDPVIVAAKSGCFKVLELLLSFGADVFNYGFLTSPLYIAISRHHTECAKLIIQHIPNMDFKDALMLAVDHQKLTYVRFLAENYKNKIMKQLKSKSEIQKLFLTSVKKGNLEIIGHILNFGADINGEENSRDCPLTMSNNRNVAKFLIDRGADVNHIIFPESYSTTPLILIINSMIIFDNSYIEVIQVLLENGASVNARCYTGESALMVAAEKEEGGICVMQLLLDHGAELGGKDKKGNTALIHAAYSEADCSENVLFLLQFIKDRTQLLNEQNNEGLTALMYVVCDGRLHVVKKLIDQGADVNIKDSDGNTALLHLLLSRGKDESEILKYMIEAGCDVNRQNNVGLSPLMVAAEKHLKDVMSILLDSGAEINAVSKSDHTETVLTCLLYSPVYDKFSIHFKFLLTRKWYRNHDSQDSCIEYLLDRGANASYIQASTFHKWIVDNKKQVIQKVIRCGFGPASIAPGKAATFHRKNHLMSSYSPLFTALDVPNSDLARFFVRNLFLTYSDVTLLTHNKLMREYLKNKCTECLDVLNELSTQPMTLFSLSFVVVSTAVGAAPGREIRVNELPISRLLKRQLLFQDAM